MWGFARSTTEYAKHEADSVERAYSPTCRVGFCRPCGYSMTVVRCGEGDAAARANREADRKMSRH